MFSCMFTRISVTLLLKRLFIIDKMRVLGLYCLVGIIFITTVPVEVANLVKVLSHAGSFGPYHLGCMLEIEYSQSVTTNVVSNPLSQTCYTRTKSEYSTCCFPMIWYLPLYQ